MTHIFLQNIEMGEAMRDIEIHIVSFTERGYALSKKIYDFLYLDYKTDIESSVSAFGDCGSLAAWTKKNFYKGSCLIFIGAAGIAVRSIVPFVKSKTSDSAVLVIPENGSFVIPILSGHIGGSNELALIIAKALGAVPVITTATDINDLFAVDVFATKNNLYISDMKMAKCFSAKILKTHCADMFIAEDAITIRGEAKIEAGKNNIFIKRMPDKELLSAEVSSLPFFVISPFEYRDMLSLIPRCAVLGVGCRKGKRFEALYSYIVSICKEISLSLHSIKALVSIDLKKDEKGLLELSEKLAVPFFTYSSQTLNEQKGNFSASKFVLDTVGVDNVCERAVFAYGAKRFLLPKRTFDGISCAIGICPVSIDF